MMEVSCDTEWTIWSVALASKIQSLDLKTGLSTIWAEKTECVKFGGIQNGLPKKFEASVVEEEAELGVKAS